MLSNADRLHVFRNWCRPVAKHVYIQSEQMLEACEFADSVLLAGHTALGWKYGADTPVRLTELELKRAARYKPRHDARFVDTWLFCGLATAVRNSNTHCYNNRPITCTYVQAYTAIKRATDAFGDLETMLEELSIQEPEIRSP